MFYNYYCKIMIYIHARRSSYFYETTNFIPVIINRYRLKTSYMYMDIINGTRHFNIDQQYRIKPIIKMIQINNINNNK